MNKLLLLLLCCLSVANCQTKADSLPNLTGYINDYEDLFSIPQEMILEESVKSYYEESNIGITVVTVESIAPYNNIFKYSLDLAIASNRGQILIVVSKKIRQIQIQNTDSIRNRLTDEETKAIIDNIILPQFKEGDYFKGLLNGILEIKKELN